MYVVYSVIHTNVVQNKGDVIFTRPQTKREISVRTRSALKAFITKLGSSCVAYLAVLQVDCGWIS